MSILMLKQNWNILSAKKKPEDIQDKASSNRFAECSPFCRGLRTTFCSCPLYSLEMEWVQQNSSRDGQHERSNISWRELQNFLFSLASERMVPVLRFINSAQIQDACLEMRLWQHFGHCPKIRFRIKRVRIKRVPQMVHDKKFCPCMKSLTFETKNLRPSALLPEFTFMPPLPNAVEWQSKKLDPFISFYCLIKSLCLWNYLVWQCRILQTFLEILSSCVLPGSRSKWQFHRQFHATESGKHWMWIWEQYFCLFVCPVSMTWAVQIYICKVGARASSGEIILIASWSRDLAWGN